MYNIRYSTCREDSYILNARIAVMLLYYIVQPMMMVQKIIYINERLAAGGSLSILAGRCRMSSPPLRYYYIVRVLLGNFSLNFFIYHQIPNLLRIAKYYCPVCVTSRNVSAPCLYNMHINKRQNVSGPNTPRIVSYISYFNILENC